MSKVSEIIDYINKHDEIITEYQLEKGSDFHIFVLADSVLLYNTKTETLEVSFLAETEPDVAANYILSFQTIPHTKEISVMESYYYDDKDDMVWGREALNELEKLRSLNITKRILNEQEQIHTLMKYEGYKC